MYRCETLFPIKVIKDFDLYKRGKAIDRGKKFK